MVGLPPGATFSHTQISQLPINGRNWRGRKAFFFEALKC